MTDAIAADLSALVEALRVAPGRRVDLAQDFDPAWRGTWRKREAAARAAASTERLTDLQARLAAQGTHGVVVVLQGIDASGKDGTIRHVMSGVNPQGVIVRSFKAPSSLELGHDFLWRYQCALPARGQLGIFNRSHYEEVLVVRVHPELLARQQLAAKEPSAELWRRRFRDINDWERHLSQNGFRVVKLLLNLSREEQRVRFLSRIDEPAKNWKFSAADIAERDYWEDYQHAFSQMLSHTSTEWAPWHVIPADRKWFARMAAGAVITEALAALAPRYPSPSRSDRQALAKVREQLMAQAPPGAKADPVAPD